MQYLKYFKECSWITWECKISINQIKKYFKLTYIFSIMLKTHIQMFHFIITEFLYNLQVKDLLKGEPRLSNNINLK